MKIQEGQQVPALCRGLVEKPREISPAALALIIEHRWHQFGHTQVRVWAEEKKVWVSERKIRVRIIVDGRARHEDTVLPAGWVTSTEICSNLVNGLPPTDEAAA